MTEGHGRRVLFADLLAPEPDRHASSVRATQLLTLLIEWGWRVDFLPTAQPASPAAARVLAGLGVTLLPCQPEQALASFLAPILSGYDLLYVAWTATARRVLPAIDGIPGPPLLFDTHDINHRREFREAKVNGNARTVARALRTKDMELAAIHAASVTLAITDSDRAFLHDLAPLARLHTVEMWAAPLRLDRRPDAATLLFLGNMGAPHNHDGVEFLVKQILPLLRARVPGVRLLVAGQMPHDQVRALATDDVEILDWVPDLAPLLARASLLVAPLRFGSGLKGKMLHAMAAGLPIVASSIAAEGMPLRPGHDVLLADDAAGFAVAVETLLADPAQGRRQAAAAAETLRRCYGRERIATQFSGALRAVVQGPRPIANF